MLCNYKMVRNFYKQNNLIGIMKFAFKNCDECGNVMTRGFHHFRNEVLCSNCYKRKFTSIPLIIPKEEALNKVYKIKGYLCKDGNIHCQCNFPSILNGIKFKIQIVNE